MTKRGLSLFVFLSLGGCTYPPSVNVLGAYFPGWLFCIAAGVSLTVVVHVMLSKRNLEAWLAPTVLTYPVLTTLFSLGAWLVFFQN